MPNTTLNVRLLPAMKTETEWAAVTSIPLEGEMLYTSGGVHDGFYKIGDGQHTWSELSYITYPEATTTNAGLLSPSDKVQLNNLQTALNAKAPLDSPAFTGIPTAPTAASGTDTTQIANTAFVQDAIDNIDLTKFTSVVVGDQTITASGSQDTITLTSSDDMHVVADPTTNTIMFSASGYRYTYTYTIGVANIVFSASLFRGITDVTSMWNDKNFTWHLKTENGLSQIGYGKTFTLPVTSIPYVGSVIGVFSDAVVIITEPTDITGAEDSTGTTTLSATGQGLTYQWYYRAKDSSNVWTACEDTGADTNTLELTISASNANKEYYCLVTDSDLNTASSQVIYVSIEEE